jgi:hypothetical protein
VDERARKLMQKILDLQNEMTRAEAELVEALHPAAAGAPRARRKAVTTASSGNGSSGNGASDDMSKRGALTDAVRKQIALQRGDWTAQQLIEKAGVPEKRWNSARSAISRMNTDGEIEKGSTPGTYRAKS